MLVISFFMLKAKFFLYRLPFTWPNYFSLIKEMMLEFSLMSTTVVQRQFKLQGLALNNEYVLHYFSRESRSVCVVTI